MTRFIILVGYLIAMAPMLVVFPDHWETLHFVAYLVVGFGLVIVDVASYVNGLNSGYYKAIKLFEEGL